MNVKTSISCDLCLIYICSRCRSKKTMISDNVIIILIYVCVDKVAMKAQKNFIAIQNKCIYKAISS